METGHPFVAVQLDYYWTSTTMSFNTTYAWKMSMNYGSMLNAPKANTAYVLAVHPVPEPANQALLALGVLAVIKLARREY